METVSKALGLPGSFGLKLDKFGDALKEILDPPRLILQDWERTARLMPRDAELLLECIRQAGTECPVSAVDVELK
jgi:hypothetical protein